MDRKLRAMRTGYRVRKAANGKARICVYKSGSNIYTQVIDDLERKTIAQISSLDKEFKEISKKDNNVKGYNVAGALLIGQILGKKLKEMSVIKLCFDRRGYPFHGRIKAIADGIRESVEF